MGLEGCGCRLVIPDRGIPLAGIRHHIAEFHLEDGAGAPVLRVGGLPAGQEVVDRDRLFVCTAGAFGIAQVGLPGTAQHVAEHLVAAREFEADVGVVARGSGLQDGDGLAEVGDGAGQVAAQLQDLPGGAVRARLVLAGLAVSWRMNSTR